MQPSPTHRSEAFTLTQRALDFMRRMVRMSGRGPGAAFRLAVAPGGCAQLTESFSIETEPREGDEVLDFGRVKLFVPEGSWSLLRGTTVDFMDSAFQSGLAVIDPRTEACCES